MVKFDPGRMRQSLVFDYQLERLSALVADMEGIFGRRAGWRSAASRSLGAGQASCRLPDRIR